MLELITKRCLSYVHFWRRSGEAGGRKDVRTSYVRLSFTGFVTPLYAPEGHGFVYLIFYWLFFEDITDNRLKVTDIFVLFGE